MSKRQGNMTNIEETNKSIKTNLELTQMLELAGKDIETVIAISYVQKVKT